MKTLAKYLTPIIICLFLIAITESSSGKIMTFHEKSHKENYHNNKGKSNPAPAVITTESVSVTNLNLKVSPNLMNWYDIGTVDLSAATYNPATGQTELFIEVELTEQQYGDGSMGLWNNTATVTTTDYTLVNGVVTSSITSTSNIAVIEQSFKYLNITDTNQNSSIGITINQPPAFAQPLTVAAPTCNMVIIGVLVLIVGGIVIYVLYKTCKRLLPPSNTNP